MAPAAYRLSIVLSLLVTAPVGAVAANRCSARINSRTGAIQVSATGVAGSASWSGSPDGAGIAFVDAATCRKGKRFRRCHLGLSGTLAEITPPAECRVCVHDDGASCCAFLRGCTPGPRFHDASFAPNDPRVCQGAAAADPTCAPTGIWRLVDGATPRLGGVLSLLVLDPDGRAETVFADPAGKLACQHFAYTKGVDDALTFGVQSDVGASVFRFARPDADTLELSDGSDRQQTFTRIDAVPDELRCRTFTVVDRVDDVGAVPNFATGLAFDGRFLWFTAGSGDTQAAFDPQTSALAAGLSIADADVHAAQGAEFWLTPRDASSDVRRVDRSGVVRDTVDVGSGSGLDLDVRALALDAPHNVLFMHGFERNGPGVKLVRVGTAPPHQLLGSVELDENLHAMTFDGTDLWAVGFDRTILRIAPDTGAVRETYDVPDPNVQLSGIAAVGGDLFLVGESRDQLGVMMRVQP